MLFALLTFMTVVAIVVGAYWIVVVRAEHAEESVFRRRLRPKLGRTDVVPSVYSEHKRLSDIPAFDAVLAHSKGLAARVETVITRSGMSITVGTVFLASACLGVVVLEVGVLLRLPLAARFLLGGLAAALPFLFLQFKAKRRTDRFEELFPEALGLIVRALRAGHAFTTGLSMAADEMDDPVGPEFRALYDQQNFGMPLEDALRNFALRVPLIDVKFFVTAVLTQRQAGGNLAEVLENLISVVRDRFKVKRQIRVVTAHARITGSVLMALPVATALIMLILVPEHMRLLWTDPTGIRLLYGAIALQVIGALAIRRIMRIEY